MSGTPVAVLRSVVRSVEVRCLSEVTFLGRIWLFLSVIVIVLAILDLLDC